MIQKRPFTRRLLVCNPSELIFPASGSLGSITRGRGLGKIDSARFLITGRTWRITEPDGDAPFNGVMARRDYPSCNCSSYKEDAYAAKTARPSGL